MNFQFWGYRSDIRIKLQVTVVILEELFIRLFLCSPLVFSIFVLLAVTNNCLLEIENNWEKVVKHNNLMRVA